MKLKLAASAATFVAHASGSRLVIVHARAHTTRESRVLLVCVRASWTLELGEKVLPTDTRASDSWQQQQQQQRTNSVLCSSSLLVDL